MGTILSDLMSYAESDNDNSNYWVYNLVFTVIFARFSNF